MDPTALGGPIRGARKHRRIQPLRPRQDDAASRQQAAQGYLAAHNLQKSYGGCSGQWRQPVCPAARRSAAGAERQDHRLYMITGLIKAESGKSNSMATNDASSNVPAACLGIGYLPQEASIFGASTSRTYRAVSRWWNLTAAAATPISMRYLMNLRSAPQDAVHRVVGGERRRRSPGRLRAVPLHAARRAAAASIRRQWSRSRVCSASYHRGIGYLSPTTMSARRWLSPTGPTSSIPPGLMEGRQDDIVNDPEARRSISVRTSHLSGLPAILRALPFPPARTVQNWCTPA